MLYIKVQQKTIVTYFTIFPFSSFFSHHDILNIYVLQTDSSSNVEIGSLDSSSVKSLERHFVLRSTAGQLPSNAFHTLMAFILHVSQPK